MTTDVNQPDPRRSELIVEYYKLVDISHKYDDYFIRIKAWGVTVSGAAVGIGVAQGSAWTFLIASLLAFAFWLTESHFKILQLDHNLRIGELEDALQSDKPNIPTPRIYGALRERKAEHRELHRWRSVMVWRHVMFPHVMFVVVGLVSGVTLLVLESTS